MEIFCPLSRWIEAVDIEPMIHVLSWSASSLILPVLSRLTIFLELNEVGGGRGDRWSRMGEHYRGGASGCSCVGSSRGPGAGEGSTAAIRVEGNDGKVYRSSDGKEGKEETRAAGVDVEGELGGWVMLMGYTAEAAAEAEAGA